MRCRRRPIALVVASCVPVLVPVARAQTPVSECGEISGEGSSWYLTGDLVAPAATGDCLTVVSPDVTLDLMGYSIVYDADSTGVPNAGFEIAEAGAPDTPESWDLSLANGHARRVSCSEFALVDSWFLEFVDSQPGDEIRSGYGPLPPGRSCSVSFIAGFTYGSFATMPVVRLIVERSTGEAVYDGIHGSTPPDATLLQQRFDFVTPDAPGETYRIRLIVVTPAADPVSIHRFAFDELDLRTDGDFGVLIEAQATNVVVRNGAIRQGRGRGTKAHAIRVADGTHLTDLDVETSGMASVAVRGGSGIRDVEIEDCTIAGLSPSAFRWMDLDNVVSLGGVGTESVDNWIHDNVITGGTGLGCIRVAGGYGTAETAYRIENNLLLTSCSLTDHHAIVVYRTSNAVVTGNTIEAIGGQGIILSSGFDGAEVAFNRITLNGIRPNVEFGLISFDGIRLNDYGDPANVSDDVQIHDNVIDIVGGLDPYYEPGYGTDCGQLPTPPGCAGKVLNGIMHASNGANMNISGNVITVAVDDPEVIASCWEVGRTHPTESVVLWLENTCASNQKLVVIGGYADEARDALFESNVFRRLTPAVGSYHSIFSRGNEAAINDVRFLGTILENGAGLDPTDTYMRTQVAYDFTQEWFLDVRVTTGAGIGVAGASVSVQDVFGDQVAAGLTDPEGWLRDSELIEWTRSGPPWLDTGTITLHTPHTIWVEGADDSVEVMMDGNRSVTVVVEPAVDVGEQSLPATTGLLKERPNPFRSSLTVPFQLSRRSRVTIQVYDVTGRLVATILDESREAGVWRASWNGADSYGRRVSPGVHYVTLVADGVRDAHKVVTLR